jgi:chemotaxis protein MotB
VLVTLLFALFVALYALSLRDLNQVKLAAQSIRQAFGGPAMPHPGSGTRLNPFRQAGPDGECAPSDEGGAEAKAELGRMKDDIIETARIGTESADLGATLDAAVERRGLVIKLSAKDFFAPGEAAVRKDLQPLLDRIGRVVASSRRPVRIEGHTDSSEERSPGYASDWELSSARASWVARYWIARFKLDPGRVGVGGYGHYQPLPHDGAQSDAARALNRRIDVIVLRQ